MNAELVGLFVVAAMLGAAIAQGCQWLLMVTVMAYAGVVFLIIRHDLGLLMPALGIAIGLGLLGLTKVVWREVSSQGDTPRGILPKIVTSNSAAVENIGR